MDLMPPSPVDAGLAVADITDAALALPETVGCGYGC